MDNRILLCRECHWEIHKRSAMRCVEELRELQLRRLSEYGNDQQGQEPPALD